MSKIKHVLILLILVLPMFALAPTLVASPNNTLVSQEKVDSSLPAQFVQDTLRVAVYAESNLTLPAYATGGVYTANYQNVIDLLESAGYAVTALSTQDILDHKLMVVDFDAFVLPNQLPKDEIVNLVKDYWLGGGGILSFDGSIGFAFYAGLIDESLEGNFEMTPPATPGYWGVDDIIYGVTVNQRHPITQTYEVDDAFAMPSGNYTIINGIDLPGIIGDELISLVTWNVTSVIPLVAAFDNPDRGGKIVQIPGDGEVIPAWLNPIIFDAIDWLAPRPKGRILVDLTHDAYFKIDSWDEGGLEYYVQWRDIMVNHSYTVDKLHPSTVGNLTATNLDGYDMLFLPFPKLNFTSAEVAAVTDWVSSGGGLFCIGERWSGTLIPHNQNLNYLLSNFDVSIFPTGDTGDAIDYFDTHLTTEGCGTFYDNAYGFVNFTGDATGVWRTDDVNYVSAADTHGDGRIILFADINWFADNHIDENSHIQYAINIANWLTASKAKILVYVDHGGDSRDPNMIPLKGPVAMALNDLGLPFYITSSWSYFNRSLFYSDITDWDMIIFDNCAFSTTLVQPHLMDYVKAGGKLIMNTWNMNGAITDYFGIESYEFLYSNPYTLYLWDAHPIFSLPVNYNADNVSSTLDVYGGGGTYALNFTTFANATPLSGFSPTNDGGAGIMLCAEGRAIMNGPLLSLYGEDTDDSTYMDAYELWTNEIAFLYYDRPTIDHPDDVTYMETETGNEISWMPVADAGPWEYVVRENGSIVEEGRWTGGAITINVDGVNASLTDYQLTVFDRLGYSVSDVVVLNVTVYVATTDPGGTPLDPTLLLIIGVGAVIVVIIVIIVMKKKK
ncbi:MAG: DUF4350 domain-containing protein [Candidatus Thorarchaeota archaeon]